MILAWIKYLFSSYAIQQENFAKIAIKKFAQKERFLGM